MVWANDNKTIFYTKQDPQTLRSFKFMLIKLGLAKAEDILIYEEKDETFIAMSINQNLMSLLSLIHQVP